MKKRLLKSSPLNLLRLKKTLLVLIVLFSGAESTFAKKKPCSQAANKYFKKLLDAPKGTYPFIDKFVLETQPTSFNCAPQNQPADSIQEVVKAFWLHTSPAIERDCVEVSLRRSPSIHQTKVICDTTTSRKIKLGPYDTICFDKQLVDYIHWTANKSYQCANQILRFQKIKMDMAMGYKKRIKIREGEECESEENENEECVSSAAEKMAQVQHRKPIPVHIFKMKINNESAFNPFFSWGGGQGVGQLTTIAVKELWGKKPGAAKGASRTGSLMSQLYHDGASRAEMKKPVASILMDECDGFESFIGKRQSKMDCNYLSLEEGFPRNFLQSLLYFAHSRDTNGSGSNISIRSLATKARIRNEDLINYLTLLSYGAKGNNGAQEVIKVLTSKATDSERINELFQLEQLNRILIQKGLSENGEYLLNTQKSAQDFFSHIPKHYTPQRREDLKKCFTPVFD